MPQSHKEIATAYLTLVASGHIREAFEKYVGPDFKHHNAYSAGKAADLIAGMEENEGTFPNKVFTIHHALEDGDMVALHSHLQLKPGELELAVVHIFRFSADRIVELWDVAQQIAKDSKNENGMF